jgi:AP-1 complex subunit mu
VQASVGTVHYVPEQSAFVWKIKQLGGGKDYLMRAHFGLPSVRAGASLALSFFQVY